MMFIDKFNIEVVEEKELDQSNGLGEVRVLMKTWVASYDGPVLSAETGNIISHAKFSRNGPTYTEAMENLLQEAKDQGMVTVL